jgi:hypothetical protein
MNEAMRKYWRDAQKRHRIKIKEQVKELKKQAKKRKETKKHE